MDTVDCPISCLDRNLICETPPDWLEKHGTFMMTLVGALGAGCTVVLSYFLKSRCHKLRCCGVECDRTPIPLDATQVELSTVP